MHTQTYSLNHADARHGRYETPEPGEWREGLPAEWLHAVVPPLALETYRDYELAAQRTVGRDEDDAPCYCAWCFVMTETRSDDDEDYYQLVAYAEALSAWRLRDGRWLIRRTVSRDGDGGRPFYSLADSMPR